MRLKLPINNPPGFRIHRENIFYNWTPKAVSALAPRLFEIDGLRNSATIPAIILPAFPPLQALFQRGGSCGITKRKPAIVVGAATSRAPSWLGMPAPTEHVPLLEGGGSRARGLRLLAMVRSRFPTYALARAREAALQKAPQRRWPGRL